MKLVDIQKELKRSFSFDVIPIQSGFYYNLFNEDILFFTENHGFNSYEQGEHILTGFPASRLDHWESVFIEKSLTYAVVQQESETESTHRGIARFVSRSSDKTALGTRFGKRVRITKADKLRERILALSRGVDPFTGEIFPDSSVWKHPEISKMLELVMDQPT